MGRPRKKARKQHVHITLQPEVREWAAGHADNKNQSLSELIEELLRDVVRRHCAAQNISIEMLLGEGRKRQEENRKLKSR